jgi:hypothetical protein
MENLSMQDSVLSEDRFFVVFAVLFEVKPAMGLIRL